MLFQNTSVSIVLYAYVIKERRVVQKIKDAKGARQGGEQGLTTIGHRVSSGVMKMF